MNLITFLNDNTIKVIHTHMYIYISGGQTLVDISIFKHSKEILEVKYTSNLGWDKGELITLVYKYHYYIPFGKDIIDMGYQLTVEKLIQGGIFAFRDIIMDYLRDNQVRSEVISLDLDKEDLGEPVDEFYNKTKEESYEDEMKAHLTEDINYPKIDNKNKSYDTPYIEELGHENLDSLEYDQKEKEDLIKMHILKEPVKPILIVDGCEGRMTKEEYVEYVKLRDEYSAKIQTERKSENDKYTKSND